MTCKFSDEGLKELSSVRYNKVTPERRGIVVGWKNNSQYARQKNLIRIKWNNKKTYDIYYKDFIEIIPF